MKVSITMLYSIWVFRKKYITLSLIIPSGSFLIHMASIYQRGMDRRCFQQSAWKHGECSGSRPSFLRQYRRAKFRTVSPADPTTPGQVGGLLVDIVAREEGGARTGFLVRFQDPHYILDQKDTDSAFVSEVGLYCRNSKLFGVLRVRPVAEQDWFEVLLGSTYANFRKERYVGLNRKIQREDLQRSDRKPRVHYRS